MEYHELALMPWRTPALAINRTGICQAKMGGKLTFAAFCANVSCADFSVVQPIRGKLLFRPKADIESHIGMLQRHSPKPTYRTAAMSEPLLISPCEKDQSLSCVYMSGTLQLNVGQPRAAFY